MKLILQFLPAVIACGLVLGVAGSHDLKRGVLRGLFNAAVMGGGIVALSLLVALASDPTLI